MLICTTVVPETLEQDEGFLRPNQSVTELLTRPI